MLPNIVQAEFMVSDGFNHKKTVRFFDDSRQTFTSLALAVEWYQRLDAWIFEHILSDSRIKIPFLGLMSRVLAARRLRLRRICLDRAQAELKKASNDPDRMVLVELLANRHFRPILDAEKRSLLYKIERASNVWLFIYKQKNIQRDNNQLLAAAI